MRTLAAAVLVAAALVTTDPAPAATTAAALHSRPGAHVTVYLDLDGHVTSGTRWNRRYTDGADIATSPFDLDGDPGTASATELDWTESIWRGVAEDFAPFDVDVTTVDPGVEALRYGGVRDPAYGVRVVIGPERAWYSATTYSGVAHVDALGTMRTRPGTDEPAFVFATGWVLANPARIADVASHEVGHTLGLRHDGVATGEADRSDPYAPGAGLWGPIMGSPFKVPLSQWSRGEYAGATNSEDDVALIGARVGFVPDDVVRPASLAPDAPRDGLIGRADDRDAYRITVPAPSELTVTVVPSPPAPLCDLNAGLVLRDDAGRVVAADSPVGLDAYGATVTVSLSPGTYLAVVDGVGEEGPDGFSDYGSLGRYRILARVSLR